MTSLQSQQGGGSHSSQGSPQPPQTPYPFFLPLNSLANMANFGQQQQQSASMLDSSAATVMPSLPLQFSINPMSFPAVAPSPTSARYSSAPLLHSPTPAVSAQAANSASLLQQQQFLNELSMQFRMPLAQQQHTLQQAMQAAQQMQQHHQQQQQQQHHHQQQQQLLSTLAQVPVSATSLDPRISPTLASTAPVTATATVRSSHSNSNHNTSSHSHKHHPHSNTHKSDHSHSNNNTHHNNNNKRKSTTQEATASLRRKKHKEVEIKRRKKINSLFLQLTNELECGPTDKASVLLYALNFIKGVKRKYGGGVELKTLTGMAVGPSSGGSGEEERREGEEGEEDEGDEENDEDDDDDEGDSGRQEKKVKKDEASARDRKTSENTHSVASTNHSPSSSSSSPVSSSAAHTQSGPSLTIDPITVPPSTSGSEESTPHTASQLPNGS